MCQIISLIFFQLFLFFTSAWQKRAPDIFHSLSEKSFQLTDSPWCNSSVNRWEKRWSNVSPTLKKRKAHVHNQLYMCVLYMYSMCICIYINMYTHTHPSWHSVFRVFRIAIVVLNINMTGTWTVQLFQLLFCYTPVWCGTSCLTCSKPRLKLQSDTFQGGTCAVRGWAFLAKIAADGPANGLLALGISPQIPAVWFQSPAEIRGNKKTWKQ